MSKHQPTTVIHLAAFTDVSAAFSQNGDKDGLAYKVNTLGSKNIAESCTKYGHYLIHTSTDFVFDGNKEEPYTEEDAPKPIEWYGQTKFWAEQEVAKSGTNHSIVRLAFPFRARFKGKLDLVRNMIKKLKDNSLYPMFDDQFITPTFIDDICEVFNLFINKKTTGIYHLVGSTSLSPFELAQKVNQVFKLNGEVKPGSFVEYLKKDPRPRQQYTKLSNKKLENDLGFTMKNIDQSLKILKGQIDQL